MKPIIPFLLAFSLLFASVAFADEHKKGKDKETAKAEAKESGKKDKGNFHAEDPMEEKSGMYADKSDEELQEEIMDEVEEQWDAAEDKYHGPPKEARSKGKEMKGKGKQKASDMEGPEMEAVADVGMENEKNANLSGTAKGKPVENPSADKKAMARAKREEAKAKRQAAKGEKKMKKEAAKPKKQKEKEAE